jgi:hypothetical protein
MSDGQQDGADSAGARRTSEAVSIPRVVSGLRALIVFGLIETVLAVAMWANRWSVLALLGAGFLSVVMGIGLVRAAVDPDPAAIVEAAGIRLRLSNGWGRLRFFPWSAINEIGPVGWNPRLRIATLPVGSDATNKKLRFQRFDILLSDGHVVWIVPPNRRFPITDVRNVAHARWAASRNSG